MGNVRVMRMRALIRMGFSCDGRVRRTDNQDTAERLKIQPQS